MFLCSCIFFFFFNDTATTEIYTLSLHDALPISTASRNGLPAKVTHADAAHNAASAALLGAGIASGDANLLRDAFDDRLHEQYRIADAPLLRALRGHAPAGTVGVTLSGSGPSVVVWAENERAAEVARDLEHSLPDDTMVLPLRV